MKSNLPTPPVFGFDADGLSKLLLVLELGGRLSEDDVRDDANADADDDADDDDEEACLPVLLPTPCRASTLCADGTIKLASSSVGSTSLSLSSSSSTICFTLFFLSDKDSSSSSLSSLSLSSLSLPS